jgi:hypothetical protein
MKGLRLSRLGVPRQEWPFLLLFAVALSTPFCVLGQGGDLRTGLFAALAVLALPGVAIEAMLGVVRLALLIEPRRD